LIFADLNMKGIQHLMVNAGFLDTMRDDKSTNIMIGDRRHLFEICKAVKEPLLFTYCNVPVVSSGFALNALLKTFVECFIVLILFGYSYLKKQNLFFLSNYAPTKVVIEFLSRVHPYRVYVVHHGELDGLVKSNTKRYAKFVRWYFLSRKSLRLFDVFLSNGIRKNTFSLVGETPAHTVVLHPFPLKLLKGNTRSCNNLERKLTVGYFGALSASNRSRLEFIIASLESRVNLLGFQDFNLLIVAPFAESIRFSSNLKATIVDSTAGLSNDEFSSIISALDLVFFPYEQYQYELAASGITSDCLVHGIHFLTAYSVFFEDWISLYPDSGTIYPTFEDLLATLRNPLTKFNINVYE